MAGADFVQRRNFDPRLCIGLRVWKVQITSARIERLSAETGSSPMISLEASPIGYAASLKVL